MNLFIWREGNHCCSSCFNTLGCAILGFMYIINISLKINRIMSQFSSTRKRVQIIDLIKGVDVILMVLFNYSVTLRYFGLINLKPNFLYWSVFPMFIGLIFIFLSGITAYTSFENRRENFSKRYFMRGVKLLILAAFVTLFTHLFVPEGTVYFGILHFFAVSSFIIPFFIKYDKLNVVAALLIIISGIYLQIREFSFPFLLWLGLMPANFTTFDYFPLMPWLGVLLLGVFFGKSIVERTCHIKFKNKLAGTFSFLGEKSLTIYLIHQPFLIFFLVLLGFRLF